MNRTYCDRCGIEIGYGKDAGLRIRVDDYGWKDLCPRCFKKLEDWFEERGLPLEPSEGYDF